MYIDRKLKKNVNIHEPSDNKVNSLVFYHNEGIQKCSDISYTCMYFSFCENFTISAESDQELFFKKCRPNKASSTHNMPHLVNHL